MKENIRNIGNTPMIKLNYEYLGEKRHIYIKLEYYNLTGSIKDRVAYYIINNAIKRGELNPDMPIIEATSGNTGIALSALGSFYGHDVYIFMPDWASKERVSLMESSIAIILKSSNSSFNLVPVPINVPPVPIPEIKALGFSGSCLTISWAVVS